MGRAALLAALLLSACGGGGGGSGGSSPPPPPPPSVALSSTSSSATANEGATTTTTSFTATVSGTASTPIVASVVYDSAFYSSVTITPNGVNSYAVSAITQSDLSGGVQTSPITVRLCQEAACNNVYAGAAAIHAFVVTVKLRPWTTFQRDATHTGFVHVRLDPSKFAKAWEWTTTEPGYNGGLIAVEGAAYLSTNSRLYRLDEATGSQAWVYVPPPTIDSFEGVGAPAYGDSVVYAPMKLASVGSFANALASIHGIDATTGTLKSESPFTSQSARFNSPVIQGDAMYYSKGDLGQFAYRYALPSGAQVWRSPVNTGFDLAQTPAVDDTHVYHAIGSGVAILNKADGSGAGSIGSSPGSGGGGFSAPVLTRSGRVLTPDIPGILRGNGLLAGDLATRTVAWRTPDGGYGQQPVSANGILYAWRDGMVWSVNALAEATGATLWSWSLPTGDTHVVENMIVCDNLLFVSSNRTVYAIDLATHQPVWTYPSYGKLTISSGFVLYITETGAPTKVTAIKLTG